MFLRMLGIVGLTVLAGLPLSIPAQTAKHALTNDDVRAMAKKGFADDLIVSAVEANPTQFDVSVDGLMSLKDGGISDKVITAMLKAEARNRDDARRVVAEPAPPAQPSAPPPAAMPSYGGDPMSMAQQMMGSMGGMMGGGFAFDPHQLPVVTLNAGDTKQSMRAAFSQIAHTQGGDMDGGGGNATRALAGLASQTLSFTAIGGLGMMGGPAAGLAMGVMGGMGGMGRHGPPKVTHVWALPGHQSENALKSPALKFEVVYGNLLGIDPDSYEPVLLRLVQTKDNWRLVGATKVQMGRESTEALAKIAEVRIATRLTRIGRGDLVLEPQTALEAGEYGLVLRPINPGKRAKGSLGGPAETNAFFSVWDFSLQ